MGTSCGANEHSGKYHKSFFDNSHSDFTLFQRSLLRIKMQRILFRNYFLRNRIMSLNSKVVRQKIKRVYPRENKSKKKENSWLSLTSSK